MKKKLFVYATLLSLICCVATVWMWIGSSEKVTTLALRTRGESSFQLWGHGGKIAFSRESVSDSPRGELSWAVTPKSLKDGEQLSSLTAFSFANGAVTLPMWAAVLMTGFLPGMWAKGKFLKKKDKKKEHH
jgi:hypothetical protein